MIVLKGCHLTGNNSYELDEFARKMGVSRCWYNLYPQPHYEVICPHTREKIEYFLKRKRRKYNN